MGFSCDFVSGSNEKCWNYQYITYDNGLNEWPGRLILKNFVEYDQTFWQLMSTFIGEGSLMKAAVGCRSISSYL